MNTTQKHNLIGILVLPIMLFTFFVPFSLFIGWNLFTLGLFWFVVIPIIAVNSSPILKIRGSRLLQAVGGLIIFYAVMVFMIYEHFHTDYFFVMMVSAGVNLIVIVVASLNWKSLTAQ
jgi:hypothetical protein